MYYEFSSEKSLKLMYTNTDVLHNKMTEIEAIANNNDIDVIAINETLPKKLPNRFTSPDDFNFLIKGYTTVQNRAVRVRRAIARARAHTRLKCWRRAI